MAESVQPVVDRDVLDDVLMQLDRWDFVEAAWLLAGEIARLRGLDLLDSDGTLVDPASLAPKRLYGGHGSGDSPLDVLCRAHHLALVGGHVVNLDGEDFPALARSPWTPAPVATVLGQCSWPSSPQSTGRGALGSVLPLMSLLLEQIDVCGERQDVPDLLAAVHLVSDYLPLAAWEAIRPRPGDPLVLANVLAGARDEWNAPDRCPQLADVTRVYASVRRSQANAGRWRRHLADNHQRVSEMLSICAGTPLSGAPGGRACKSPCSVVPAEPDGREALARRMALARAFRSSAIVVRRHGSPVGHFFSVPSASELRQSWRRTCDQLSEQVEPWLGSGRFTPDGPGALPGFGDVIAVVAGRSTPLKPAHVLRDLVDAARATLDPVDT